MFELGFSEIILILIVALLVLGPQRLPVVARQCGLFLGKVRRFWSNIQNEVSSSSADFRSLTDSLRETTQQVRGDLQQGVETLKQNLDLGSSAWERLPAMRDPEDFQEEQASPSLPTASEHRPTLAQKARVQKKLQSLSYNKRTKRTLR